MSMRRSVQRLSRFGVLCLAVGLAAVLAPAASADVIIGATNTGNVFPVGSTVYLGEYQQVYAASAFPGPMTIGSVSFASDPNAGNPSTPVSVTFSLSLSTTSAAPNAMSTNYAANRGADFTTVFSGPFTYTPISNGSFDFVVPTAPFNYNPGLGNLLVDINVTSSSTSQVAFNSGTDPATSRVFNFAGTGAPTADSNGLQTRFGTGAAPSAPEPSALALAGSGSVLALAVAWRKRRRQSADV
jgi:PEP-CTERM motif-containing protein